MGLISKKFREGESDFERATKRNFQFSKFWRVQFRGLFG